jgi:ankyrin repeat protein
LELLQQTEGSGKTVLHKAAQNKSSDVMKCLLESLDKLVPDPAKRWQFLTNTNQFGDTALHDALRNENPKVMKCLLESLDKLVPDRAKRWNFLTQANAYGKTALDLAIDHKKMNQAALLLANGADPNAFTDKQPTEATQLDNAALLLANAADPNAFTDEQPTAATQWVTTIPNACRNISKTTLNELASVTAEQKKKEH